MAALFREATLLHDVAAQGQNVPSAFGFPGLLAGPALTVPQTSHLTCGSHPGPCRQGPQGCSRHLPLPVRPFALWSWPLPSSQSKPAPWARRQILSHPRCGDSGATSAPALGGLFCSRRSSTSCEEGTVCPLVSSEAESPPLTSGRTSWPRQKHRLWSGMDASPTATSGEQDVRRAGPTPGAP